MNGNRTIRHVCGWLVMVSLAVLLAACCELLDLPGCDKDPTGENPKVLGASGNYVEVQGTWVSVCQNKGTISQRDTQVFSGNSISSTEDIWNSNTTCSGAPESSNQGQATFTSVAEETVGWDTTPPDANAANVLATVIEVSFGGGSGFDLMFVDDYVTPWALYWADDTGPVDAHGHPTQLKVAWQVLKQ